jgi:hypothetical protein
MKRVLTMIRWLMSLSVLICVVACSNGRPFAVMPSGDASNISAISVYRFGGFDTTSYKLLLTDDGCAFFSGWSGHGGQGLLKGRYVGTRADLGWIRYLVSKDDLLAATPGPLGERWPIDGGGELLTIFHKGNDPAIVYASPHDPPQARILASMIDGVAFNTDWVPYRESKKRVNITEADRQVLQYCQWPNHLWAASIPRGR